MKFFYKPGENLFGLQTDTFEAGDFNQFVGNKADFQKIDDLGYLAEVWVRLRPTFAASTQGLSVRVDTGNVRLTQQQDVLARAVMKFVPG